MTTSNLIAAAKSRKDTIEQKKEKLKGLKDPKKQKELIETLNVDPEIKKHIKSFSIHDKVEELGEEEVKILAMANDFVLFLREHGVPEKKIKQIEDLMYDETINEAPETTKETLEGSESRLFQKENFTLSEDWKKKIKVEGFKEKEHYYIKNGNFYCRSKKLMEFILWGREAAKKRTIDRYNWAILKSGDTKSSQLPYTCTDKELTEAFKESKARKEWIKDPTVKQKFDNVNNPVGLVASRGDLGSADRSFLPLWSPERGEIFNVNSDADEWRLYWYNDNDFAFPLSFSAKNS